MVTMATASATGQRVERAEMVSARPSPAVSPSRWRRPIAAVVLGGTAMMCVSCGHSASSSASPHSLRSQSSVGRVQIVGKVVQVGGPVSNSGGPASRALTAAVTAFAKLPGKVGTTSPVAVTRSNASDGGGFVLDVAPGLYEIVARTDTGLTTSKVVRVVSTRANPAITLDVVVP